MPIETFTKDVNNIQALSDTPTPGDMSAEELKAKFDQAGADLKDYINNTLVPAINGKAEAEATESAAELAEAAKAKADEAWATATIANAKADGTLATAQTAAELAGQATRYANDAARLAEEVNAEAEKTANKSQVLDGSTTKYPSNKAVKDYVDSHGGTGGTTDYTQLSNKPRINGHTLTADSTAQDLGLATHDQIPGVDPTLTVSGAAADAKVVGDKLSTKQGKSDDFRVAPGKALFFDNDSSGSYLLDESVSPQMPVIAFYGDAGDDPVILRYIASPQQSGDAANKGYVDTEISDAVGSIDSLLATMVATYEEVLR